MPDLSLNHFSIPFQEKLSELKTPAGPLVVYQTAVFGKLLTLNHQAFLAESDGFFYHEMLVHPALFTHTHLQKVAVIGNGHGIIEELLKHKNITQIIHVSDNEALDKAVAEHFSPPRGQPDVRLVHRSVSSAAWAKQSLSETVDLIIHNECGHLALAPNYTEYQRLLTPEGIFLQPGPSSLLDLGNLTALGQTIRSLGFKDCQYLNFPQPSFPSGWRTILMATKRPTFKRVREKDIYNKDFTTRYYNFDTHKAALALPEFIRAALP